MERQALVSDFINCHLTPNTPVCIAANYVWNEPTNFFFCCLQDGGDDVCFCFLGSQNNEKAFGIRKSSRALLLITPCSCCHFNTGNFLLLASLNSQPAGSSRFIPTFRGMRPMRFLLSVTWRDYDGEDGQEPPCHFYREGLSKAAKQNKHTQTVVLCGMTHCLDAHILL